MKADNSFANLKSWQSLNYCLAKSAASLNSAQLQLCCLHHTNVSLACFYLSVVFKLNWQHNQLHKCSGVDIYCNIQGNTAQRGILNMMQVFCMIKIRRSWGPPAGHGALSRPLVQFCLGPALHIIYRRLCINNLLGLFGCELCFCKRFANALFYQRTFHNLIRCKC